MTQERYSAHDEQLHKIIVALARLEERDAEKSKVLQRLSDHLDHLEVELGTWQTTRRVMTWLAGIVGTVIGAVAINKIHGGG